MPYSPQTWADHDPTKPASAARFTHIETGITDVDTAAAAHGALTTTAHGGIAATTDSRFPSQGENDALVGTSGTPGSTNAYVTDADSRLRGVSVKAFGAVGNGSTDDRASIQAAIDSAAADYRPVYFEPGGVYLIGDGLEVYPGTRLVGDHTPCWMPSSLRSPEIRAKTGFTNGSALIRVLDNRISGHAAAPNGGSITGLVVNGNSIGTSIAGIFFYGESADWRLRDVEVFGCSGHGFRSELYSGAPQQEVIFDNCHAWANSGSGWYFAGGSYDHLLTGCISHNNNHGFELGTGCASIQFIGCRAEYNADRGFQLLSGDKVTLHGCITDRNGGYGIYVEYAVGGPCLISGAFLNRDITAGLRIHNSNIVVVDALTTRVGREDDGSGAYGPTYGIDTTGTSKALIQGYLQATTAGYHDGGGGSTVKFSGTTGLHTGSPPSSLSWQAATS